MSCEVINPTAALPELGEVSACTHTTEGALVNPKEVRMKKTLVSRQHHLPFTAASFRLAYMAAGVT